MKPRLPAVGRTSPGPAAPPGRPLLSQRGIFLFWSPLAAQWLMMAAEGPFLAAIIARMGDPAYNLAAYGVAFVIAVLVEAPVIMLMSAATALVEDAVSYRRLRNFANALNAGSTALLVLLLAPPVYRFLTGTLLGLPGPVTDLMYGALWLLLPWPAAIGYRRFLHGVLIRSGRTRLVAYGTILRLFGMAGTGLLLYRLTSLPGAWVGAIALSAGVCVEALAAGVMSRAVIRELNERERSMADAGTVVVEAPGYRDIGRFYYPLALTSLIGLMVQPLLTFLMGRSIAPLESLAVFPVVHALSFIFRAAAFSFQEAGIALTGARFENARPLARFATVLAILTSGGLALVAYTPMAAIWFGPVSGLPADLTAIAVTATRLIVPMPALALLLAYQQAILVRARKTQPITRSTALEIVAIAILFFAFGQGLGWIGVNAAAAALVGGRTVGSLYLLRATRAAVGG